MPTRRRTSSAVRLAISDTTTAPLYEIKADLFRSLAHPTRIRALEVLSASADYAALVSDLLAATGAEASVLSQHMAVLKRAGVVASTRTGNIVVYRLSRPLVAELLVVARAFLRETLAASGQQLAADGLPPLRGTNPAPPAAEAQAPAPAAAPTPGPTRQPTPAARRNLDEPTGQGVPPAPQTDAGGPL